MDEPDRPLFRPAEADFRWRDVELLAYKQDHAAPFRDITRQVLFHDPALECELRYFEMAARGFSTLERHRHMHAVTILRGNGCCLVGDRVFDVAPRDLVTIPPWTWHQFKADKNEPMGFLCMVNADRDRPVLPTDKEMAELRSNPAIARFLDL